MAKMVSLENLKKYSLTLALVGLLLPLKLSNITTGIFLLISIISLFKVKGKNTLTKKNLFFAGFLLLFVIGLIYTEDLKYGFRILEKNLLWILVPLLIPFGLKIAQKDIFKSLLYFAIANYILGLFLIIVACYKYIQTKNILVFYYDNLTEVIGFHPVYLAVYLLFSLLIVIYGCQQKQIRLKNYIKFFLIGLNVLLLILLSSKMVLASFMLLFFIMILRSNQSRKKIAVYILGLLIAFFVVMQFSETRERIKDSLFSSWKLLDQGTFKYNDPFTGITLRLITWKFVMQKFIEDENIVIGVGTGDAREFINQVYRDRNMDAGGYINFNMHNQYLEFVLKFGLLGLIYFLTILFLSFKKAMKDKNSLYFSFLLLFCIFSLTESNLEVQRGIVFFILFNSIFYFQPRTKIAVIDE